jgi:hypothetical protein
LRECRRERRQSCAEMLNPDGGVRYDHLESEPSLRGLLGTLREGICAPKAASLRADSR